MGRFGIGARVRDADGDEATIIGKPSKGFRTVRYDKPSFNQSMHLRKAELTLIEGETVDSAEAPAEQWVPKAGDRVRFKIDNPNGGARYGKAGQDVAVVGDRGTSSPYGRQVAVEDTGCGFKPNAPVSALEPLPVAEHPTTPTPLTIEAGKFYRTRDGRKVGPIELSKHTLDNKYPFRARVDIDVPEAVSIAIWQNDGTNYEYRWLDLVAEWVDDAPVTAVETAVAPATAAPKFKVGDKVRIVRSEREFKLDHIGREFVIYSHCGELDGEGSWNGDFGSASKPYRWKESELELATPAPTPTPSFIVARLTPTGKPLPSTRPTVHASRDAADTEAQRLADKYGDNFAVYERVSVRELDAGPVPDSEDWPFRPDLARYWLEDGHAMRASSAFNWGVPKQGEAFWVKQAVSQSLTPLGRAILTKWIAQATPTTTATPTTKPANDDAPVQQAA